LKLTQPTVISSMKNSEADTTGGDRVRKYS
jgi:hypothetical protein